MEIGEKGDEDSKLSSPGPFQKMEESLRCSDRNHHFIVLWCFFQWHSHFLPYTAAIYMHAYLQERCLIYLCLFNRMKFGVLHMDESMHIC